MEKVEGERGCLSSSSKGNKPIRTSSELSHCILGGMSPLEEPPYGSCVYGCVVFKFQVCSLACECRLSGPAQHLVCEHTWFLLGWEFPSLHLQSSVLELRSLMTVSDTLGTFAFTWGKASGNIESITQDVLAVGYHACCPSAVAPEITQQDDPEPLRTGHIWSWVLVGKMPCSLLSNLFMSFLMMTCPVAPDRQCLVAVCWQFWVPHGVCFS